MLLRYGQLVSCNGKDNTDKHFARRHRKETQTVQVFAKLQQWRTRLLAFSAPSHRKAPLWQFHV